MNRKNLTAAVLAGLAGVAGIAGTAQAVNINPDGTGQVLLYPYYTTNNNNMTLISVVNTTEQAKAVKVRFLEGFNSREVLDFNLYMSREDVWTAVLADSSAFGAEAGVPHLYTTDSSCTVPYLFESASTAPGLQAFLVQVAEIALDPHHLEREAPGILQPLQAHLHREGDQHEQQGTADGTEMVEQETGHDLMHGTFLRLGHARLPLRQQPVSYRESGRPWQ